MRDDQGNLYGTTFQGGDPAMCSGVGCGVVFKVDNSGSETVLYRFGGGTTGSGPSQLLSGTVRGISTAPPNTVATLRAASEASSAVEPCSRSMPAGSPHARAKNLFT